MRISGCYMNMIWFRCDLWYGCYYTIIMTSDFGILLLIWCQYGILPERNHNKIHNISNIISCNQIEIHIQHAKKTCQTSSNPRKIGCPNVHPISINFCWRVCPRTGKPYTTSPRIFEAPRDSEETNEDTSSQAWEALCKPFCPNILRCYFHQYIYYICMYIRTCKYVHVLYINTIRYM